MWHEIAKAMKPKTVPTRTSEKRRSKDRGPALKVPAGSLRSAEHDKDVARTQNYGFAEDKGRLAFADLPAAVQREVDKALSGRGTDSTFLDTLLGHGFSREELFDLVVPRRTFARRLQTGKLSPEESDRAVRLARLAAMAERVFGDHEKAHRWLRKPSPMLEGSVPLALLKTETGAHLVEQTLHRIDYGMFA